MNRTPVESSNIVSVGYDKASKTLEVEFKGGGIYRYAGVPTSEYQELLAAKSVGGYLNANIKNVYEFEKPTAAEKPKDSDKPDPKAEIRITPAMIARGVQSLYDCGIRPAGDGPDIVSDVYRAMRLVALQDETPK